MTLIESLLLIAAGYLLVGLAFAVPFLTKWVGKLDSSAQAGSWGFRVLILPGTVLLWPVLAWRLRGSAAREGRPPLEATPHKRALAAKAPGGRA